MPYGLLVGIYGLLTSVSGWSISEITLPYGPQKLSISGAPNEADITQSGEEPIITIDGLSGTTLTLSGTLADDSRSDEQLWNDVISPLLDLRGTERDVQHHRLDVDDAAQRAGEEPRSVRRDLRPVPQEGSLDGEGPDPRPAAGPGAGAGDCAARAENPTHLSS